MNYVSSTKQIMVTGGAGFLGSHLCERLLDAGHDLRRVRTAEWPPSGGHLEQDRPQRENVAPRIQLVSANLLGRHVRDRSDNLALPSTALWPTGQRPGHRLASQDGVLGSKQDGETEIHDLCVSVRSDEDIARLEVAMQESFAVGAGKRAGDLRTQLDDSFRG